MNAETKTNPLAALAGAADAIGDETVAAKTTVWMDPCDGDICFLIAAEQDVETDVESDEYESACTGAGLELTKKIFEWLDKKFGAGGWQVSNVLDGADYRLGLAKSEVSGFAPAPGDAADG